MKDRIFSIRYWMVVRLPFNIGCGFCKDCEAGLTAYCLTVYPGMSGAVKHYNRHLRNLIHAGRAKPSWIISRRLSLDEAPNAYEHFDARDNEWTKVVLRPAVRYGKLARKGGPNTAPSSLSESTLETGMERRYFGPTRREVAVIGQGTWYGENEDPASAIAALRLGLDLGMKHIDTAEMYGSGAAERSRLQSGPLSPARTCH
jgi:hypothetical protein